MNSAPASSLSRRRDARLISFGYFGAFVALGLVAASLGPTLNGLAAQTGVAISQISLLITARALGYFAGSLFCGRLYDRLPGHPLMAGMLLLMAVCIALVPALTIFWLLVGLLWVVGIAEAVVDVGGNAMIGWVHGAQVGPYMNALHFFFGAGALISPLIVGLVLRYTGGISWSYWLLAALIVPSALWTLWMASPVIPSQHSVDATGVIQPVTHNRGLVLLAVIFMLFYVGAEVSFGSWISTYAVTMRLATQETAAYLTSVFWGALTVGRLLSIPVAVRLRPRAILLMDVLGCIVSVGLILLLPQSVAALWVGAAGLGLFMASIFPTVLSWAGRRMTMSGNVTSWFLVGASMGAVILPSIIGWLFDISGPRIVIGIIFADLLLLLVLFVLLMAKGGEPEPESAQAL